VFAAFRRLVVDSCGQLGAAGRPTVIAEAATLINASPALQAREREIVARYTQILARLLAEETSASHDDAEPLAVASALMGAHRALVTHVRSKVLAGGRGRALAADARSQATRAFARLEKGLADYATKKR
jgi:hypothetical protein